jgi:hypothetical protein
MKKDITQLFCFVDDFCKAIDKWMKSKLLSNEYLRKATREPDMSDSEIITIILLYHQSPCKNFKYFYYCYLQQYREEFPNLLSYNRFLECFKLFIGMVLL